MTLLQNSNAKVILSDIFTDNMVLQRNSEVPVWGKSKPNTKIELTASWDNGIYETVSDEAGKWSIKLNTPDAGGPYKVSINDGDLVVLNNIMSGELWLCSGQSNMEMPLGGWGKIMNYEDEIENANHPNIRLFQIEKQTALSPTNQMKVMGGGWLECSPNSIPEFSATAYFFARTLSQSLNNIPIGLIHTSWGGTPVEAWISEDAIEASGEFSEFVSELKMLPNSNTERENVINQRMEDYRNEFFSKDKGFSDKKHQWNKTDYNDSQWHTMNLPGLWENQGLTDFDGVMWYRKEVILPKGWENKELNLNLGMIDDNEITYLNGYEIGKTEGYTTNRNYTVHPEYLVKGKNVIAVRVTDTGGGGGFHGDKGNMFIQSGSDKISIAGNWKYNIGLNISEVKKPIIQSGQASQPSSLFNGMINPVLPFKIRGAIWYQGEANVGRGEQYKTLFPLMIENWRNYWGYDFPFYFVQLANYLKKEEAPENSDWAELREAQESALNLVNTGMATIIDIGNALDIHPKNKQEVGRRLALAALANTYSKNIEYSGPVFKSFEISGDGVKIYFDHVDDGLHFNGNVLKGFAIAGPDRIFHFANASIEEGHVMVSCPDVKYPIAVRYGWADNPDCNLYNSANLPATPFRTDQWNNK